MRFLVSPFRIDEFVVMATLCKQFRHAEISPISRNSAVTNSALSDRESNASVNRQRRTSDNPRCCNGNTVGRGPEVPRKSSGKSSGKEETSTGPRGSGRVLRLLFTSDTLFSHGREPKEDTRVQCKTNIVLLPLSSFIPSLLRNTAAESNTAGSTGHLAERSAGS